MVSISHDVTASQSPYDRTLIETQHLNLIYGTQPILRDINLIIPRGQTLAIIGESGCGKTMLLKSIVNLIKPTSGKVFYDGRDIHALSVLEMTKLRRKFGFVFQNAALFDSMTIGENVAFPVQQQGLDLSRDCDRMVRERLAEVGLPESVIPKRPSQLSGGMRKRVGLARALILEPELVLYDEPTTGLDPIMSDVINELILRTRQKYPVTSIVVTHDMRTAKKVADRIIMLYPFGRLEKDEPQIIYDGPPSGIEHTEDRRVRQFVEGEAGERLMELRRWNDEDLSTSSYPQDSLKQI